MSSVFVLRGRRRRRCCSQWRFDLHHSETDPQSSREIRSDSEGGRGGGGGGRGGVGGGGGGGEARSANHLDATPFFPVT